MTLYLSKAIMTIVQIDVLPNKEPVIPYSEQANGPRNYIHKTLYNITPY